MNRKELADRLGISASMVSRLARRGMPTDTAERAERWRRRHIEPGRMKGTRMPSMADPDARAASAQRDDITGAASNTINLDAAAALARVRNLAMLALDALAGNTFAIVAPMLRRALQAVPIDARRHVAMPIEVWDKLTESIPECGGGGLDDFTDEFMGTFWYQVALGPEMSDQAIQLIPRLQTANADLEGRDPG